MAALVTSGRVCRLGGRIGTSGARYRVMRFLSAVIASFVSFAYVGSAGAARFIEPEQAFRFDARAVDTSTIDVHYRIADGYYLYRERFKFALDPVSANGATLGEPVFPKGEIKYDETFAKDVEHYRGDVVVRVPVVGAKGPVTLLSTSQGCADAGLCYPPQTARAVLTMGGAATSPAASPTAAADDASALARTLGSGNLAWIALVFAGLGVLLSFTPCVLPMVPILSSILVGQSRTATAPASSARSGAFLLAVTYSLGMALVYTALGVAAGLAGEGLAAMLQTPWVLGGFAALLVVLSLSMFGFYELQVPSTWQTRLAQWSGRAGDSRASPLARLAGVFAMGAISALIVGPCVAAPLAGALVYISQTRNVVVGGVALFSLAVGMSVPLLLLGLSAGALLPRVGPWMESVKKAFGTLLLAVALWMVTPILPAWLVMVAWAALSIVVAVYLRAFDALPAGAPGGARFVKGIGILLVLVGAIEFVGVATGGRDVLQPLGRLAASTSTATATGSREAANVPPFERVKTVQDLERRIASAGKPVLLDFYADWCVSCKEMERFTYTDARVAERMKQFVLLQADVTANDADDRALLKRFALFGPPGIIFFDGSGRTRAEDSVIGFQDADRFLTSIARVQSEPATADNDGMSRLTQR